ncbi:hypothetical protein LTR09_012810 [Extremus antarcticus]|uniref:Uncharacterized protein n=1 Tax=Extremus antarcticus TaxID=702011 RepID=A0AAJ0D4A4_9PEZI|nr:hypothetical protein LTR09_012810 [Extremus antarcticus]
MASKIILVTGGNRGIGFGTVQQIARLSSDTTTIITARDKAHAEKSITELQSLGLNSPFHALALDVTDDSTIQAAVTEIDQKFGRLDVLINNAGITLLEPFERSIRPAHNLVHNPKHKRHFRPHRHRALPPPPP